MDFTSKSRCFVVLPASGSATCRSSYSETTCAWCAWKYHFPKMSEPPTCTNGSTGNLRAFSWISARRGKPAITSFAESCPDFSLPSSFSPSPAAFLRAAHKPFSFHCSKSSSMFWSSSPSPRSYMRVAPSFSIFASASLPQALKLTYCRFPKLMTVYCTPESVSSDCDSSFSHLKNSTALSVGSPSPYVAMTRMTLLCLTNTSGSKSSMSTTVAFNSWADASCSSSLEKPSAVPLCEPK
mmetsp:Transcript_73301/g.184692  ORF Transcript_73301/g.184692 Transcript_73301/m.184692 type:complete len:239 (+) Transcript_73301:1407-2123(+)